MGRRLASTRERTASATPAGSRPSFFSCRARLGTDRASSAALTRAEPSSSRFWPRALLSPRLDPEDAGQLVQVDALLERREELKQLGQVLGLDPPAEEGVQ